MKFAVVVNGLECNSIDYIMWIKTFISIIISLVVSEMLMRAKNILKQFP